MLPSEWKRSLRRFASWCEGQVRQYGHIVDADYLMRHDTSVVGGRSVDDLRFVPDVDMVDGTGANGKPSAARVSRCALMPGKHRHRHTKCRERDGQVGVVVAEQLFREDEAFRVHVQYLL